MASAWMVRTERPGDAAGIDAVNVSAFDGRWEEAALVAAIRRSASFVPSLSLVAEANGQLVGCVMLSRAQLRDGEDLHEALVLAPLAVVPEWQRRGVGTGLTSHALGAARSAGHRVVVLIGHTGYYPRFGFEPSAPAGIDQPFPIGDASQVLFLDPTARGVVKGTVGYPDAFRSVPGVLP